MENLLTIKEVMEKLKVSRITVHNLRRSGKLKSVQFGRAVRFRSDDVKDLIVKSVSKN